MPYASVPAGRLYYEIHGEGEPLLLHPGFGCTVEIYWRNIEPLSRDFRVIVFDPRGAGRSDAVSEDLTMQDLAQDAVALLDVVGAAAANVFGTSFGGMVAQHIAIQYPTRVRKLVLGCTTPGGAAHVMPPAENMARFMAASDIADPVEAMRSTYFINYSDEFASEWDPVLVGRARANEHLRSTPEGRAGQVHAIRAHDTVERLRDIVCPTLIAHGTDDGTVPVDNGKYLARRIRGSTLRLYPGGRHLFFTECADALNEDIRAFLQDEPLGAK